MKKIATKLTPAIKEWIKREFGSDYYETKILDDSFLFCFPNYVDGIGFKKGYHLNEIPGYTEVSEADFLAEFDKEPIIQYLRCDDWLDFPNQSEVRIKPKNDYSTEIEALNKKANENGMKVTINFEKI